jgi:predicted deacylase
MQRRVFEDDQDLNRSFGFAEPALLSQKVANTLCESAFRHCQFGIDLHDAGGRAVLVPHARVHAHADLGCPRNTHDMGRFFGIRFVVARPGKEHMLAIELYQQYQIPVLTVEIGGAQRLYEEYYDEAIEGLLNIFAAFGMLEREVSLPERQFLLHDRYGVKVSEACQVRFRVRLGEQVHVGEILGELYFPHRNVRETIHSPMCGYVFLLWSPHQAPQWTTLYSILEEDECHVERSTLGQFELLPELKTRRIMM